MNKLRLVFRAALFVSITLTLASAAQSQASRTWVSGVGDDANPCSRTAPCKSFAGAISKTASNGEINALDAGGFGQVVISKSITIDGTGILAGILATGGGTGITINSREATGLGLTTSAVEPASAAKRVHHYVFFGQDSRAAL